jgi:hypothetical protein
MVIEMRILTVKQPWAWAIMYGGKDIENRTRNLAGAFRGPVAIHAGVSRIDSAAFSHPAIQRLGPAGRGAFRFGEIIGIVDLTGVHQGDDTLDTCHHEDQQSTPRCSAWGENGTYHLELNNPRPLTTPLPYTGGLGLRRLNAAVSEAILHALSQQAPVHSRRQVTPTHHK